MQDNASLVEGKLGGHLFQRRWRVRERLPSDWGATNVYGHGGRRPLSGCDHSRGQTPQIETVAR